MLSQEDAAACYGHCRRDGAGLGPKATNAVGGEDSTKHAASWPRDAADGVKDRHGADVGQAGDAAGCPLSRTAAAPEQSSTHQSLQSGHIRGSQSSKSQGEFPPADEVT